MLEIEDRVVSVTVPLSSMSDKFDASGTLLKNSRSWKGLYSQIFNIHQGRMRMAHSPRETSGGLVFPLEHIGCPVTFDVSGIIRNGSITLSVPTVIGNCSEECKGNRLSWALNLGILTQSDIEPRLKRQRVVSPAQPTQLDLHASLARLNELIVGNDWAKQEIVIALQKFNEGQLRQPVCFTGPAKVGKAHLISSVADLLKAEVIQIDMKSPPEMLNLELQTSKSSKTTVVAILHIDLLKEKDEDYVSTFLTSQNHQNVFVFATAQEIPSNFEDVLEEILIPGYNNSQKKEILMRKLPEDIRIENVIDLLIANDRKKPGMDGLQNQIRQLKRRANLNRALDVGFEVDHQFFEDNVEKEEQPKLMTAGNAFGVAVVNGCGVPLVIRLKARDGEGLQVFASFANKESADAVTKAVSAVNTFSGGQLNGKHIEIEIESYGEIDGDSSFAATACAALSFVMGKNINNCVVTGAGDMNGHVKSVGGIAEKALCAARFEKEFLMPFSNRLDFMRVDKQVRDKMQCSFIKHIREIHEKIGSA